MERNYFREFVQKALLFGKRYGVFILIFTLLSTAFGYYKAKKSSNYYKADIYLGTGLILNLKSSDVNVNAVISDLTTVSTHIRSKSWVKENFNVDSTGFLGLSISNYKPFYNRTYSPVKLTLKAKNKSDFEKFKQGLLYYYQYKSPLVLLYQQQKNIKDTLNVSSYNDLINSVKTDKQIILNMSDLYQYFINVNYVLSQPLVYFTSDFSQISYISQEKGLILVYAMLGLTLSFLIAIFVEIIIYNYKK